MPDFERLSTRYSIASGLEDTLDIRETDAVANRCYWPMPYLQCWNSPARPERVRFLGERISWPKSRVTPKGGGARWREFFRVVDVSERARIAVEIADSTIGAHGFFAWDSGLDQRRLRPEDIGHRRAAL